MTGYPSNRRLGVHTQHEFALFSVEHFLNEVEVRKTAHGDEQRDVGTAQFKHRSILHAATHETITRDGPRLRAAIVSVVPDHNPL